MTVRIAQPFDLAPEAYKALLALEAKLFASGIEHSLIHLIKTRVSQINGCARCLHMHTTHAREAGESEMRLHLLAAWRESSLFSPRERAALGWAEALTLISQTGAPDAGYAALADAFTPAEQVNLSFIISSINAWNRLVVGFRLPHPVESERAAA